MNAEFPSSTRRIYLDNAATSWPKPPEVYAAVDRWMREVGAPAGRGAYREALESDRVVAAARSGIARLLGSDDRRRIIFTAGATDSLNLVLHGWLNPGDHVVTTAAEHNSVLRPLRTLGDQRDVAVTRVACDGAGRVDPDDVRRAMRPQTRLVAVVHASNVTGAIQPVAAIGRIAREAGAALLVDAAQTLGHIPFTTAELQVDFLAASGHKGLLGLLGAGILFIGDGQEARLRGLRQGGTGTRSEDDHQPDSLPDKYEPGSMNLPGLAGLAAAVEYLQRVGVSVVASYAQALTRRLLDGLSEIPGVRLYGPAADDSRLGVVSITINGYDPQEAAALLDATFRIQARGGLHCAPLAHRALGTLAGGGTLRLSLGPFNTEADADAAIAAITALASGQVM